MSPSQWVRFERNGPPFDLQIIESDGTIHSIYFSLAWLDSSAIAALGCDVKIPQRLLQPHLLGKLGLHSLTPVQLPIRLSLVSPYLCSNLISNILMTRTPPSMINGSISLFILTIHGSSGSDHFLNGLYLETRPEFNASQVNGLLLARCMDTLLLHPSTPKHSHCPNHLGVYPESSFQDYASTFWLLHCVSCRPQDRQRNASFRIQKKLLPIARIESGTGGNVVTAAWLNGS